MNLTKEQLEAINSSSKYLAIIAGAGSGKTLVLAQRIKMLLEKRLAMLDDILAITFTEKAANELKERIAKIVNDPIAVSLSYIGTFHSFCARTLREHAPIIGIDPDFRVIEETQAILLMQKAIKETLLKLLEEREPNAELAVNELEFRNIVKCLEEMLCFRAQAQKMSANSKDKKEAELQKALIFLFNASLEKYKALKGHGLDFQDLEIFAIDLLKTFSKKFKYVLVDEFQDVNDTQAELINLLFSRGKNSLTIVGDARQSIYRFRGANVSAFENAIKNAETCISLTANFRSRPEIISFINSAFAGFPNLCAVKPSEDHACRCIKVESAESASIDECRANEAKKIAEIIPHLTGATACLFASLKSSQIYSAALDEYNIPHITVGGYGFFDRQEIKDIINALKVACDSNDIVALLALARSPYIGLSDEDLYLLARRGRQNLYENIKKDKKGGILKLLEERSKYLGISELIKDIALGQSFRGNDGSFSPNVEKLIHIARTAELAEKITLKEFLEYIDSIRENGARISDFPLTAPDAVNLMTIHQAKGLEFDNVILADAIRLPKSDNRCWRKLSFKLRPEDNPMADAVPTELFKELDELDKRAEEAEKLRLLYVAITRAKERLLIPIHPGIKKDGEWHKMLLKACNEQKIPEFITFKTVKAHKPSSETAKKSLLKIFSPPDTFTMTELEVFAESKEKYYERFILNCADTDFSGGSSLPANIHGDIVHRLIEQNQNFSNAAQFLDKTIIEYEVKVSSQEKDDILSQFYSFKNSRYGSVPSAVHETPFLLKTGGFFVKGKIDMLIANGKSWEIVDFKTGKEKDYSFQAKVYSLAVSRHKGLADGTVTFLFLTPEKAFTRRIPISAEILKETESYLIELFNDLKQSYNQWMQKA